MSDEITLVLKPCKLYRILSKEKKDPLTGDGAKLYYTSERDAIIGGELQRPSGLNIRIVDAYINGKPVEQQSRYYLLQAIDIEPPVDETKLREAALAKLTPGEILALGLTPPTSPTSPCS